MSQDSVSPSPAPGPNEERPAEPLTPPSPSGGLKPRAVWGTLRWFLLRAAALLGSFLLLILLVTAAAGWYTSRPQFCASCHIMEPYYKSWQESTHKDVSCIECHFPPGFGGKIRGKMLGLVQLAKYVTQSEGPRPAAEIPDKSCLRSGCHETRLLAGRVEFHGVPFDHERHVGVLRLGMTLRDSPHLGDVRREMTLRCTSCHSQIVQGSHMVVTTSTCFLCHFKDGLFNEGLGRCTRCHQIPDKKFDLGGGIMFTHDLAYERGVDCANCHGDLIRGKGEVPHERCLVCHNREDDLKQIDRHEFLHKKHVTDHKIDCLECHLAIQHSLDRDKIAHAASDCAACHPDHHHEQVQMLEGVGARTIAAQTAGMVAIRVDCRTCHRMREVSSTGTVLWRSSAQVCTACHEAAAIPRFEAYEAELKAAIKEMASAVGRIREALKSANLKEDRSKAIRGQIDNLQHDLDFLRVANGIHNIHYASTLTSTLLERVSALCRELKIAEPQATLPRQVGNVKEPPHGAFRTSR